VQLTEENIDLAEVINVKDNPADKVSRKPLLHEKIIQINGIASKLTLIPAAYSQIKKMRRKKFEKKLAIWMVSLDSTGTGIIYLQKPFPKQIIMYENNFKEKKNYCFKK
jgi:hypothetical protein